jgi:hypothetical protein
MEKSSANWLVAIIKYPFHSLLPRFSNILAPTTLIGYRDGACAVDGVFPDQETGRMSSGFIIAHDACGERQFSTAAGDGLIRPALIWRRLPNW